MTRLTTSRYVGGLFIACVLLQRFAVPGTEVALLLPVVLLWSAWGISRGVLVLDRQRSQLWLAAAGSTALAVLAQVLLVNQPLVSVTSWGLFMVTWAPFALRLVDRGPDAYSATLRVVANTGLVLALVTLAMMGAQVAGMKYSDWLAAVVPNGWLLHGYVITYPLSYTSEIYRSNAWIGLEPSMVSLQLGLGLLAALLSGIRPTVVLVSIAGLVCTVSGSGVMILVVGLLVMLAHPVRRSLRRYALPAAAVVALLMATSAGATMFSRVSSSGVDQSASLRGIQPYQYLWPTWIVDPASVVFGRGAGSSQRLVEATGLLGLLVATPIKVFFDYGILAGLVLAAFLLVCYMDGPSRAMSTALLVSLWAVQPGTTTAIVVVPVLLVVTWWSPRSGRAMESHERLSRSSRVDVRGVEH
jgi:hypothetical protein